MTKKSNKIVCFNKSVVEIIVPFICVALFSCNQQENKETEIKNTNQKTGLLLVNHGSRSDAWRQALIDLETSVKDSILAKGIIKGIKTAHMEYTEPSIATRLKEFDSEEYTDIIVVPVFLTVSPHTFEDIPTIIGQKEDPRSLEVLKMETIERYTPKAKTYIAPTLDFTDILKKNVSARVRAISKNPDKEGLVLIGYGDETYSKEWGQLFDAVAEYVKQQEGITDYAYGWCRHIAHYSPDSTSIAINKVLKKKEAAVVIPVLVAPDEKFQIKIIGDGIAKIKNSQEKVIYKPDAILPDTNVKKWIIKISCEYADKIRNDFISEK